MRFEQPLAGEKINEFRSQEHTHEQPLGTDSYVEQYRRKETDGVEDVSEIYHENTKLDGRVEERLTTTASDLVGSLRGIVERIDPDYTDRERIDLPQVESISAGFGAVLASRRSAETFRGGSIDLDTFAQCLSYAAGQAGSAGDSRTYPSPGALYPSELFPVVLDVDDCRPGLYHYNSDGHYLRRLQSFEDADAAVTAVRDCLYSPGVPFDLETANVLYLIGADLWRAKFKYGPRGYRYVLQESGHVAQNLLTTLTAVGLAGRPLAAFRDRPINEFVGLDGVNEAIVYAIAAGRGGDRTGDRDD